MNESIRAATIADADVIAALHAASWRSAYRGILKDSTLGPTLDGERRTHWRGELAAMVLLGSEVIVGAGNVPRAPRASMRPYPKVPSGGLLPSWVAPPCSAATSWDTVRLGNALRISAATAPAFGADADVP